MLTEAELLELERLEREAFKAPWTYEKFEIECPAEDAYFDHECVTVESPDEYPDGQCVCQQTIVVPGLETFAIRNGQLIVAARNALPSLLAAARMLPLLAAQRTRAYERLNATRSERDELRRQVANIRTMARDCNGQQIVEALTGKDMMGPALRLSVILDAISATEPKGEL